MLLDGCVAALKTIAQSTKDSNILVFVGVPYKTDGVLYNCAAVVNGGKVLALIPKRHLPNYAEFYEKRNFQPYKGENRTVVFDGEEIPFGNKILSCAAKRMRILRSPRNSARIFGSPRRPPFPMR